MKHKDTQALWTENCLHQVQENRQIIIKEEGNKKDGKQEEADVKKILSECIRRFKTKSSK